MLENPMESTANIANIKRYAPPNQRNRSHGRKKSGGDKLERANSYASDGEKNQFAAFRNLPVLDHGDPRSSSFSTEYPVARIIALQGSCNSDAFQLLNNQDTERNPESSHSCEAQSWTRNRRWQAAMNAYENPSTDLAERPTLYSGSGMSAWGQFRLPHQIIQPPTPSSSQMDFLTELRQAMHNSSTSSYI